MSYPTKLDNIEPSDLCLFELEIEMRQLLALCRRARKRFLSKFVRLSKISAAYAAWLYHKRSPSIVTNVIESPGMIKWEDKCSAEHYKLLLSTR